MIRVNVVHIISRRFFLTLGVSLGGFGTSAYAQTATNLNALNGLAPFSTLGATSSGQAALASNYATTGAIQNGVSNQPLLLNFGQQQQQALKDATITSTNAYQLADGLGSTLGGVYQSKTSYTSTNDGLTASSTSLSSNVANLISYTYSIAGSDSNSGKYFFANGTTNGTTPVSAAAAAILSAAGGVTDVYGKAYNLPAGATGADPYGDSRPYQTLKNLTTFSGTDFFGVASGNKAYLYGPTQNLTSSPSFPSGHTTYGFTESLLLAIMVPERYQQMVARGAEYGNDRIILGAHYAMDVIAGRTIAMYDIAQMLANNPTYIGTFGGVTTNNYQNLVSAAASDMRTALQAGCGDTIAACASQDNSRFSNAAANKAFYESTQTYGLPVVYANNTQTEDVGKIAPEAGYLLQTRFPYLTQAQRNDVLTSTEGPGGGFLDDGSAFGLYSRLDLYAAASGYGSFASQVNVTMNAALGGFNAADTWSNNIGGPGGLTLNGTGALTLSGADTYTGPTIVNGGVLEIAGSIVSPTSVNAGGILAGAGSLGAVTVNSGGVLAPGSLSAIGTMTINGPLTLAAGSTYAIRATPGANDQTFVAGVATLGGGAVSVNAGGRAYNASTRYTILTAQNGVFGQFGGVSTNLAFLTPGLSYDANDVYLTLTRNNLNFAQVAATSNQAAVGTALTLASRSPMTPGASQIVNSLYQMSAGQAQSALDNIGGAGLASAQVAALQAGAMASSTMTDQGAAWAVGEGNGVNGAVVTQNSTSVMSYAETPKRLKTPFSATPVAAVEPERTWRVWGSFYGGGAYASPNASNGAPATRDTFYGGLLGVDYQFSPQWLAGIAMGGSNFNFNADTLSTSGNGTGYHVGGYGVYKLDNSYIQLSEMFSLFSNESTRTAGGFGSVAAERLKGSYDSYEWRARVELGHRFDVQAFKVTPFGAIEAATLRSDAFTEQSSSPASVLALTSAEHLTHSTPLYLGVKTSMAYMLPQGWLATPYLNAAWVHEFSNKSSLGNVLISTPTIGYTVDGARAGRDLAQTKAGLQLSAQNNVSVYAEFDGVFSSSSQSYAGKGGVKYSW